MSKLLSVLMIMILPAIALAAPLQFGRIVDIKGSGFISYEGRTHEIKKGEVIYVNSEIIIENSGQVVFTDNADHKFHLGNASTAALFAGKLELRSGDVWVQSLNKTDDYLLTSANASVNYTGGEAIFSYDSVKGKAQLMVISGLMKFSNLRSPELNLNVAEGNFSFVDPTFEEGMPRDPTPVGQKTYGLLVGMFPGVTPLDKRSADVFKDENRDENRDENKSEKNFQSVIRSIASKDIAVESNQAIELEKKYKLELLKRASKKVVSNVDKSNMQKPIVPRKNELVIKIYGLTGIETSTTTAIYDRTTSVSNRAPASVSETILDQVVPKDNLNINPTTPQYKESEKLIEQLNKL